MLCLIISFFCNEIPTVSEREELHTMETNKPILNEGEIPLPPNQDLQKMDKGDDVIALQYHLIRLGYSIHSTGCYDEYTTWAVTDFQFHKDLMVTGMYEQETREAIQYALEHDETVKAGKYLSRPTYKKSSELPQVIENPYDVTALVNKQHALPSDYVPLDLVVPNIRFSFTEDLPQKQLRKIAAHALEELFAASDEAGMELFGLSGYRSYDRQGAIFARNASKHGEKIANTFSARPGESEHQSGLTMDVTCPEVDYNLTTKFGGTKEGQWIKKHASKFGFIVRYPLGKEDITEYQYEPWHIRYIGKKIATKVMANDLTLEEYFGVK